MAENYLLLSYAFFFIKTVFSPKNRPLIAPNPDRLPVAEYRKTWYHVIRFNLSRPKRCPLSVQTSGLHAGYSPGGME